MRASCSATKKQRYASSTLRSPSARTLSQESEEEMNSITIGPLFVPASPPPTPDPEVVPLGVSIEMAGADGSYQAPLYRKASRWNPHLCKLTDILVHEADLPC